MALRDYMIKIVDPRIPDYIYSMFPSISEDVEKLQRIYSMYRIGNDTQYSQLYFMFNREARIITKVLSFRVNPEKNIILCFLPIEYPLILPLDLTDCHTPEELHELLSKPIVVDVVFRKGYLVAEKLQIGTFKTSKDIAKELWEEVGASVLLYALGLKPRWQLFTLYLPRYLGLFKGFQHEYETKPYYPLHVMQFSPPATGKSTFADRVESAFNYEHLGGEFPSLTRLIGDARNGSVGIVGIRDGIIFDEFDKTTYMVKQEFILMQKDLQTGMEQGKWKRGKGGKAPTIYKYVNFICFGNNNKIIGVRNAREAVTQLYDVEGFDAFVDRFIIVDNVREKISIMEHRLGKVLPNHILRGLIAYLQDQMKLIMPSIELKGRLLRHYINFKAFLEVLNLAPPDNMVIDILKGNASFTEFYPADASLIDKYLKEVDLTPVSKPEPALEEEKESEKEITETSS